MAVSSLCEDGNEDTMHEVCILHKIPSAWEHEG